MRLLYCGDVVGRTGRKIISEYIPILRKKLKLDFVIVNGENASGGFGISNNNCSDFLRSGVDVVTSGNHIWDQRETYEYISTEFRLLRPINFPQGTPGRGDHTYTLPNGKKILVINAMARLFMDPLDDPFHMVDAIVKKNRLGIDVDFIFVDFHGEACSEKTAMGVFLDGRVSVVVGSHTHIPTADHRILPKGTAYQTDTGMCGDYDSVIGMQKKEATERFITKMRMGRLQPAEKEATLCGLYVELDDKTGLATKVAPVRKGGVLQNCMS